MELMMFWLNVVSVKGNAGCQINSVGLPHIMLHYGHSVQIGRNVKVAERKLQTISKRSKRQCKHFTQIMCRHINVFRSMIFVGDYVSSPPRIRTHVKRKIRQPRLSFMLQKQPDQAEQKPKEEGPHRIHIYASLQVAHFFYFNALFFFH